MFQKLAIQILFDGPDLSKSSGRFQPLHKFEDILENCIAYAKTEKAEKADFCLQMLTIYKSIGIKNSQVNSCIDDLLKHIQGDLENIRKLDDIILSKIITMKNYCSNQCQFYDNTLTEIDHLSQNIERVQFLEELELEICIQFWENTKNILVTKTSKCSECLRTKFEENK